MTWAKILSGLLSLVKPLVAFLIYLMGKRDQRNETDAAQAKKDAELAKEYADIASEPRDPRDEPRRMRDGGW